MAMYFLDNMDQLLWAISPFTKSIGSCTFPWFVLANPLKFEGYGSSLQRVKLNS